MDNSLEVFARMRVMYVYGCLLLCLCLCLCAMVVYEVPPPHEQIYNLANIYVFCFSVVVLLF